MNLFGKSILAASLLAATACDVTVKTGDGSDEANQAAQQNVQQENRLSQARMKARSGLEDLRFLVDISDRKLRLFQGEAQVAEHDVAVGTSEWPTPTGSWQIHRVDLNPEWNPPPDESWSEDRETKAPGAPDNPLGRARLVYRMPNTIHGTDDLESLGKAESHGSIRVANDVVLNLAQTLLRAGGAWEGEEWFRNMAANRTTQFQIPLEHPVPILVQD
jgi:murein L,D-transpeptidase YcbB/YkuD